MSTYAKPPSRPDVSLPSIEHTPEPKSPVWDPELDPTPKRALADQIADNARSARMLAKVAEVQQKQKWTFERSWNYLRDSGDPDFQVEEEESSPPPRGMSPRTLDQTPRDALKDQTLARNKQMM